MQTKIHTNYGSMLKNLENLNITIQKDDVMPKIYTQVSKTKIKEVPLGKQSKQFASY